MLKIKIRENLRYFDTDDTDFQIQAGQIKELSEKYMKSYSIKLFLFTGKFVAVEGEAMFNYKAALVHVSPKGLYGKELGKYSTKDLEFDTLTFIDDDQVPKDVFAKLNNLAIKEVVKEKKVEVSKEEKIDSMTKKEVVELAKKSNIIVDESLTVDELRDDVKSIKKSFKTK